MNSPCVVCAMGGDRLIAALAEDKRACRNHRRHCWVGVGGKEAALVTIPLKGTAPTGDKTY